MQDIHLTLNDPQLEQSLLRLATQQQQNLPEFVLGILSRYVNEIGQTETLNISKLDPFQHSQAPTEKFQTPENSADILRPAHYQKTDDVNDLGGFFKSNTVTLSTEELCETVDLTKE